MAALREFWRRFRGALRRNPADPDLERELRFHLELAEEELRGQGHSRAEAARLARVRLGGVPQALEALRDQRGLPWLDDLRTDVRIGLRGLARRPGFTATAALTLSIGIGATAAVATWTNGLLLQPLPVPDPEELVMVAQLDEHTAEFPHELSYPEYLDYRERSDVFEGLAAYAMAEGLLSIDGGAAERIRIEYVSDNYFDVLQLDAELGRTFLAGEGLRPGDAPYVVLTYDAWQTRFGGDATILGKAVRLGRASMTVIGITPEPFDGVNGLVAVEAFVPATEAALVEPGLRWADLLTDRMEESFFLTGRLRPGVTFAESAAQLDVLNAALAAEHPDASRYSELHVVSERDSRPYPGASRHIAPLLTAMMGLASLVLLIAVANVGTLLVGRGVARRQEMALRAGLGATRRRLVRQLTTESVLVALLGGAGAVLVALWAADLVAARAATELARSMPVRDLPMDWRIFGFTATVAIVAGLLAGLAPALRSTRIDLAPPTRRRLRVGPSPHRPRSLRCGTHSVGVLRRKLLARRSSPAAPLGAQPNPSGVRAVLRRGLLARAIGSGGRGTGAGSPGRRLTNGLVVVQVAVSLLLLVCAGLFVQSSRNADATDFGFRTDDLLVLSVDPLAQGYDREQARALYREIADEVGALPGVRSASWARRAPVRPGGIWGRVFTRDGGTAPEPDAARVARNYVDPAFFDTLGIPVLQGRGFREEDGAGDRRVALVSERAARELWPGQEAVGRRIVTGGAPFEVIGVVRDAHMSRSPFEQPPFVLYPFGSRLAGSATLHVRVDGAPSALLPMVTEAVRRHAPTLAILEAGGMDTVVRSLGMLALARGGAAVVGSFGMLGLLLAAVGLYGVVSHAVVQRQQEFGIRAALGASSAAIIRLALGRGIVLTTLGLAFGAVAAVAAARLTAGLLFDIRPGDPLAVLGVAGLLLAAVALLACLVPARRAAAADPLATLREG